MGFWGESRMHRQLLSVCSNSLTCLEMDLKDSCLYFEQNLNFVSQSAVELSLLLSGSRIASLTSLTSKRSPPVLLWPLLIIINLVMRMKTQLNYLFPCLREIARDRPTCQIYILSHPPRRWSLLAHLADALSLSLQRIN
jgi:hypothetical protein